MKNSDSTLTNAELSERFNEGSYTQVPGTNLEVDAKGKTVRVDGEVMTADAFRDHLNELLIITNHENAATIIEAVNGCSGNI